MKSIILAMASAALAVITYANLVQNHQHFGCYDPAPMHLAHPSLFMPHQHEPVPRCECTKCKCCPACPGSKKDTFREGNNP